MRAPRRLPAEPLLRAVAATDVRVDRSTREGARHARALASARERGWVTCWQGDRLAVELLGEHPTAIWGDVWDEDLRTVSA